MMQHVYAFGLQHYGQVDWYSEDNDNNSAEVNASASANISNNVDVGVNSIKHTHDLDADPTLASSRPDPLLSAKSIVVLWSSWCDVVIGYWNSHGHGLRSWHVRYLGTGLNAVQKAHVCDVLLSEKPSACVGARVEDGLNVTFFGDAMHHGLRGYVLTNKADSSSTTPTTTTTAATSEGEQEEEEQKPHQTVVLFATDAELANGVPDVQAYRLSGHWPTITDIKILSDDSLLLLLLLSPQPPKPRPTAQTRHTVIYHIPSVSALRTHLSASDSAAALPSPLHTITVQCDSNHVSTNATTTTLLDADSRVWTWSADTRYQRCLGRPYDGESALGQVTFLSETHVTKVVSGGYMSAALSAGGDLFVWGQACPGCVGEVDVLGRGAGEDHGRAMRTGITVEGEQDDDVKCLVVYIDGMEASVYDVAIGHGHVLVAAEAGAGPAGARARAVFAAGDNARGQLGGVTGESFHSEFIELMALRGKRIAQLSAAGWSSFVVTLEE